LIPYFGGVGKDLLSDRIVIRNPSLYFNGCEGWNIAAGLEKLAEKVAKLIKEN
jgi:hypothetical protein